ncbi:hypothetical protein ABPG72_016554 [Tetrahymena utriculariae]
MHQIFIYLNIIIRKLQKKFLIQKNKIPKKQNTKNPNGQTKYKLWGEKLQDHCALQGLCKYWNRGTCNNSMCKYQHTCVASIQPLKVTQNSEITLIISQQITLSPSEAAKYITENYKNSKIGLTILLKNKQFAANLKKIVRGNTKDKMMQKDEVEKMLLLQTQGQSKKQQGKKNKNKIQITKQDQNRRNQLRSETNIDQINQSIFPSSKISAQQINQSQNKQQKHDSEKIQLLETKKSPEHLGNQNTQKEEIVKEKLIVSNTPKGILKNKSLTDSSHSLHSLQMDSKKSSSSSSGLFYQDTSPKNENPKIPPKTKSTILSDQTAFQATSKKMLSQLDQIEKQENEHHKQILAINTKIESLLQDQNQIKKEFDLLLSMNSSKKDSSTQSNNKQKKK